MRRKPAIKNLSESPGSLAKGLIGKEFTGAPRGREARGDSRGSPGSAESPRYVVLGETVARVGEQAIGLTDLDQLTEMEVRRAL